MSSRRRPTAGTLLSRALRLRCPICGQGPLFRSAFRMNNRCGGCGLDWRRAMSDGEDYELCFAVGDGLPPRLEGLQVTEVGRVIEPNSPDGPLVVVRDGQETIDVAGLGWEHRS